MCNYGFASVLLSLPQKSYATYVPILSTSLSTKLWKVKHTAEVAM
jgi:hypothetical protein